MFLKALRRRHINKGIMFLTKRYCIQVRYKRNWNIAITADNDDYKLEMGQCQFFPTDTTSMRYSEKYRDANIYMTYRPRISTYRPITITNWLYVISQLL